MNVLEHSVCLGTVMPTDNFIHVTTAMTQMPRGERWIIGENVFMCKI